jgi:hypothetical protein
MVALLSVAQSSGCCWKLKPSASGSLISNIFVALQPSVSGDGHGVNPCHKCHDLGVGTGIAPVINDGLVGIQYTRYGCRAIVSTETLDVFDV